MKSWKMEPSQGENVQAFLFNSSLLSSCHYRSVSFTLSLLAQVCAYMYRFCHGPFYRILGVNGLILLELLLSPSPTKPTK